MALQPRGYLEQLAGFNLGPLLFSPAGVTLAMGLAIFPVLYFAVSRSMRFRHDAAGGLDAVHDGHDEVHQHHLSLIHISRLPETAPGASRAEVLARFARLFGQH